MKEYILIHSATVGKDICHYGVKGQKWGIINKMKDEPQKGRTKQVTGTANYTEVRTPLSERTKGRTKNVTGTVSESPKLTIPNKAIYEDSWDSTIENARAWLNEVNEKTGNKLNADELMKQALERSINSYDFYGRLYLAYKKNPNAYLDVLKGNKRVKIADLYNQYTRAYYTIAKEIEKKNSKKKQTTAKTSSVASKKTKVRR